MTPRVALWLIMAIATLSLAYTVAQALKWTFERLYCLGHGHAWDFGTSDVQVAIIDSCSDCGKRLERIPTTTCRCGHDWYAHQEETENGACDRLACGCRYFQPEVAP